MSTSDGSVGIMVGGGKPTAHTLLVVAELGKHLARAIDLGRDAIGTEIVRVLGETGGVHDVTLSGCMVTMPPKRKPTKRGKR